MPLVLTPSVPTTTMVNTLSTPYVMWVVGPSQFALLSPVVLSPSSFTSVNSNFVNAWVQQNQDQMILTHLQVYPVGYMAGATFLSPNQSVPVPPVTPSISVLPPVVTNATFTVNTAVPLVAGQTIGIVSATNSPTAWSFLSDGTAFSISSSGSLTLNASGTALQFSSVTQSMTVQASNSAGAGAGAVTVNLVALQALFARAGIGQGRARAATGNLVNHYGLFAKATVRVRANASTGQLGHAFSTGFSTGFD